MGRIKELFIEQFESPQRWVSEISFTCPKCGEVNRQEVDVPEPNYAAEKSRDMTVDGEVEFSCEECGEFFEGNVWAGPAQCDIELRSHPDVHVSCDPPGYDRPPEDWDDDWEVPDDPKAIFVINSAELRKIIDAQASAYGGALINRMIFAQILTFLEAYLCNNLIKGLRDFPATMITFAEKDGAVREANISASEVLRDPNIVSKWIEHNLKNRLYHQFGSGETNKKTGKVKLEGVPLWYATSFGFPITPTEEELNQLRDFAILRHDCVHRNGETKEGEVLKLFDKEYLLNALNLADSVVSHISIQMDSLTEPSN